MKRHLITLSLMLCLHWALPLLAASAEIELFYSVNQKLFRVTSFEDGLPKLDQEAPREAAPRPERLRHFQWQVKGELPLDPRWAMPILDYQVQRIVPSYKNRQEEAITRVKLDVRSALDKASWSDADLEGMYVIGWYVDGALTEAFVGRVDAEDRYSAAANFIIPESERSGYPLCWVVKEGEPMARQKQEPWDAFFFGPAASETGTDLFAARDADGNSALHYAASGGLVPLVEALLQNGKKLVREGNKADASPLRYAVRCGREEVASLLRAAKAPLQDGPRNLHWIPTDAVETGYLAVLKALAPSKPRGGKESDLYSEAVAFALNRNFEDQALYLLDLGATFRVGESANKSGLVLEKFANGYPELGFRLMERLKVKATVEDEGFNLSHAVAGYADIELLERLRAVGCAVDQRTSAGVLPMDIAAALGNVEAICWLIDNGGRNPARAGYIDPIYHAVEAGQETSITCLIDYGYDVNREASNGFNPIMFAAYKGETEIARLILAAGGAWMIDHPLMDLLVARLMESDAADLVLSLLDQGWSDEWRIGEDFSLPDVAAFFEAEACLAALAGREEPLIGRSAIHALKNVTTKPKLLSPFQVRYPLELQRKYGDQEPQVEVALNRAGRPSLLRFESGFPFELRAIVEASLFSLQFEPARLEGNPVPLSMKLKAPLKTTTSSEAVFELAEVDKKPQAKRLSLPVYPYALRSTRGSVLVEFVLLSTGEAAQARVVSSTHSESDGPALASVLNSEWSPAIKDGVPVACKVRLPINFTP